MELGTQEKAKQYNYWLGIVSQSSFKVYGYMNKFAECIWEWFYYQIYYNYIYHPAI